MQQQAEESNVIHIAARQTVIADTDEGYTRIANTLFEAVYRCELPARQLRVLLSIIRRTYGFHRKTDWITASQIAQEIEYTGGDGNIRTAIRQLKERKILISDGNKIGPNPVISDWETAKQFKNEQFKNESPTVQKRIAEQFKNESLSGSKTNHTKESIKESIKENNKKRAADLFEPFWIEARKIYSQVGSEIGSKKNALEKFKAAKIDESQVGLLTASLKSQATAKLAAKQSGQFASPFKHLERWIKSESWEDSDLVMVTAQKKRREFRNGVFVDE